MKTIAVILTGLVLVLVSNAAPAAVTEAGNWTQRFPVSSASPRLVVRNVWGSVSVRTGDTDEIVVTASELRTAADQDNYDRSLETLRLHTDAGPAGLSLVVGDRDDRWKAWEHCRDCRVDYQFDIRVPPGTHVDVATVMDGRVEVAGVGGTVSASNVNGPVSVSDIYDCESISSVNGRIELRYARAPVRSCQIETINGDIALDVPAGTGLDVALDLFNGDISSELEASPFELPATVEQVSDKGRKQYRIQKLSGVRIGAGGPLYSIASMNGDVRIRKNP